MTDSSSDESPSLEFYGATLALNKVEALEGWANQFQPRILELLTNMDRRQTDQLEWSNELIGLLKERDEMANQAFERVSLRLEALETKLKKGGKRGKRK